jgi:4-aminobutyrate aminotransferase-like enzyme
MTERVGCSSRSVERTTSVERTMQTGKAAGALWVADGNVLKVRPPLAFTRTEVPVLVDALDRTLAEQPGR